MKISCGIIIVNEDFEILMGHVTGNKFYDIPKGMLDEQEEPINCAIRECQEEISLLFEPTQLKDLGVFPYNREKNLHLFLTHVNKADIDLNSLVCNSFFEHHYTKKQTPEVDGFKWISSSQVIEHCAKSMGKLLTNMINAKQLSKNLKLKII